MSTQAIINEEYPEVHIGTSAPADGAVIWVDTGDENVTESAVYDFDSLALLRAQTAALSVGMRVRTCGYYSKDDGGGALYEICSANTVSGEYYETLSEGDGALYARFIPVGSSVNIRQFGAKQSAWSAVCDEKTDSSRSIQSAVDFIYAHLKTMTNVVLPAGRYDIAHTVEIPPFVRLVADGHVELVAKFQRPTGTQLYYLSDAGVMVQAGNDKITDEDTIIYEKIEYAAGKYAYYEYSVPMLHIKSRYHKVGDQTVIDGHPLCDDYNGSTISNAYLIGGDGNLYFLNDSDKNKSSSGYTSRFISGIKIGTEQESLDKDTYKVPNDHPGGTYNNFRIGGIRIRDMKHGIIVHPINFYSDRFRDMVFHHCGVGFKYGSRYYLPGASDGARAGLECEEQNNSGELISFESCVFTGNDIDVDYNATMGEFAYNECHFDFSRCAHNLNTNATISMNQCHIEGVAKNYISEKYSSASNTDEMMETIANSKVPYGIVYSDFWAVRQKIYLTGCAVVDSCPVYVPLFTFINSGSDQQRDDGHYNSHIKFTNTTYHFDINHEMSFSNYIRPSSGAQIYSEVTSGFLVNSFHVPPQSSAPFPKESIPVVTDGLYFMHINGKCCNVRPASDRDLLLTSTFMNGDDFTTFINKPDTVAVTEVLSKMTALDRYAKAYRFTNNGDIAEKAKLLLPDKVSCRKNDGFYAQILTRNIPYKFEYGIYFPVVHKVTFTEYNRDNKALGSYTFDLKYNVTYSGITADALAERTNKNKNISTSACNYIVENAAAEYFTMLVELEIPVVSQSYLETSDTSGDGMINELQGVFLYRM